jgi:hypothetical protein
MANETSKQYGAPKAWDSMAGFLPAFVGVMAVLLIGFMALKGYLA